MSPGPQNDLPICPDATWITLLANSFMIGYPSGNSGRGSRASTLPTCAKAESDKGSPSSLAT
jgi:hypothetical protein